MILRETITIEKGEEDWQGDVEWVTFAENVPVSMTVLDAPRPADFEGPFFTRYLLTTTYDLTTVATAPSDQIQIVWNGKTLTFDSGLERHTVDGRFSHVEIVVKSVFQGL